MRSNYKKLAALIVGKTPLWRVGEWFRFKTPRILFYHGVIATPYYDHRVQANQIQFKDFREQILFLKRHFEFISIDEFYQRRANGEKFSGKEIVLTFDDGYKNNLYIVAPFLNELKIPFTVFVSTGAVDTESFVPTYYIRSAVLSPQVDRLEIPILDKTFKLNTEWERLQAMDDLIYNIKTAEYSIVEKIISAIENQLEFGVRDEINSHFQSERILSWNEVKLLYSAGATIGSHGVNHCILHANQTSSIIEQELTESKNSIINNIGECKYFAFPNGSKESVCTSSLQRAANLYDMSFGVNGKSVSNDDAQFFISRIGVAPFLELLKVQLSILS